MVKDTDEFFFFNRFYIPRFSDLEQDYTPQENVEYEQLAVFVQKGTEEHCRLYFSS